MSLLADENIDRQVVERLREDGFSVVYVAELEAGAPDDLILRKGNRENALLITADKDFGELIFHQKRLSSGVVLVRLEGLTPATKAGIISATVQSHADEFMGAFSVISPGGVRIRR
ncbi:DUF5615 family PIN-like protein [Candidatus Sumerlaeota bacterium]|nr:DUF5615 family PIN-like protein [Candidatus Sumerlaeota bacterium]